MHRGSNTACTVIGEAPTDNELSDGRTVLLHYDGRQGKRVRLRPDQREDRDGCDGRNARVSVSQYVSDGWIRGGRGGGKVRSTIDPSCLPSCALCRLPNALERERA